MLEWFSLTSWRSSPVIDFAWLKGLFTTPDAGGTSAATVAHLYLSLAFVTSSAIHKGVLLCLLSHYNKLVTTGVHFLASLDLMCVSGSQAS
jgi:hypothetical protein